MTGIKDNPKASEFWCYTSSRTKTLAGVENLRTETRDLTVDDVQKAQVLNAYFSSVCTEDDLCPISHTVCTDHNGPVTLDTGILPEDWALADVVPVYKKGSKDDPNNYRPVSLTSIPCKVLESIIRDQLMEHLQSENLLADAQHGFRPGRSCATQLLLAVEEWSRSVEQGDPIDILYLDLSKAFNTV